MKSSCSKSGQLGVFGMTLLELLVVVAILAVLASVAIQSTSEVGNQTRYDATQKSLSAFREAVLGPQGQTAPDGSPLITGFIADMGRPPRSRLLSHPEYVNAYDLQELYSESVPSGLFAYRLYTADSGTLATDGTAAGLTVPSLVIDPALRVPAGWRGPYIRKPGNELSLVDGWNKALVSRFFDLGTGVGDIIQWPTMLLAFRTNSTFQPFALLENTNYTAVIDANRDVAGVFTTSGFEGAPMTADAYSGRFYSGIMSNDFRVPITVTVNCASTYSTFGSPNFVIVMLYGPNPSASSDGRPIRVWAQQSTYNSFNTTFAFDNANAPTAGTRVLRAILRIGGPSPYVYSRVIYFPIRPGIQNINIPLP
jgi:prepilin-type N-terminal cleavage/methylation domain-containing protein